MYLTDVNYHMCNSCLQLLCGQDGSSARWRACRPAAVAAAERWFAGHLPGLPATPLRYGTPVGVHGPRLGAGGRRCRFAAWALARRASAAARSRPAGTSRCCWSCPEGARLGMGDWRRAPAAQGTGGLIARRLPRSTLLSPTAASAYPEQVKMRLQVQQVSWEGRRC